MGSKTSGYILFAFFYNLFSIVCPMKNKVFFFNGHDRGFHGNLRQMYGYYKKYHSDVILRHYAKRDLLEVEGRIKRISGLLMFFVAVPYHMATSRQVFLNDNFIPLMYMHTERRGTDWIQLWHGPGAFKKFGLSTERDRNVRKYVRKANKKITHMFVTSKGVIPYYEEAFEIDRDRIYATGLPATDLLLSKNFIKKYKERFYVSFPQLRSKKILLYMPTFREKDDSNMRILSHFDADRVRSVLSDEYAILIKLHPKFKSHIGNMGASVIDVTDHKNVYELYAAADMLVTDYSSAAVEYSLLDRPVFMYAYDLEHYDRGFYRDYRAVSPGVVAGDMDELCNYIGNRENIDEISKKRHDFVKSQYDYIDCGACRRIAAVLAAGLEGR